MPMPGTKWEPAKPLKTYDSLISSIQFKNIKPFNPTYEKDGHVNMYYLLGWQYGRLWFQEQQKWEVLNYPPKDSSGEEEIFRRQYVVRGAKKHKRKP